MLRHLAGRAAVSSFASALAVSLLLALPAPVLASTVLTFDISGGVTNFQAVPPEYGDRVAATPDAGGGGPLFTPNVSAAYGTEGELPALWTSGYGDLVNVYYNDQDSDTTPTLTLTADTGFHAQLLGFSIASFSSGGQTIPGFSVLDGQGGTLFSQGPTFVPGAASGGHATFDFGPDGLEATAVALVIDLTGLGMATDNIAIDDIVFAQAVPEPGATLLLALALLAGTARGRLGRASAAASAR